MVTSSEGIPARNGLAGRAASTCESILTLLKVPYFGWKSGWLIHATAEGSLAKTSNPYHFVKS
jgi:hypothetical protein